MGKKKQSKVNTPEFYIRRACECWLKVDGCFCSLDSKATRYSVRKNDDIHSRWETINEALIDGRKRVGKPFQIIDELTKKEIISYE